MKMKMCKPLANYVIIEEIHSKVGMPRVGKTPIGPSLWQVMRRVLQVCDVQSLFFNGKRIKGVPSTWQYIQEFLRPGKQITQRSTGKRSMILAYAGFSNIVQPLPKIGNVLPKSWTAKYNLGQSKSWFIYGKDPIPKIRLYGNVKAEFIMPGGKPPATAVGIYKGGTKKLVIPPLADRQRLIKSMVKSK